MPKRISANPDEGGGYRNGGRSAGVRASSGRNAGTAKPRSFGINIVLFVLIAGVMGAGWFITVQAEQLSELLSRIEEDSRRLARLEDRSTRTDDVMAESGKDTGQKLERWEDEIRKLWDVTNKRNKKWIVDNQTVLKKNAATLASINTSLQTLKGDVSRHDSAIGLQQKIQDSLTSVDLRVRQLVSQQRDMVDQANATRQIVAKLEAGLALRVKENEKAIEAIDAYRLQLNSRMSALSTRLDRLSAVPNS
ncbi:MAG: hypothetical protein KUG75_00765 [Pseudomonadales bacterium]|nr:hypothetical protein [Pseudomonadales bacterium]